MQFLTEVPLDVRLSAAFCAAVGVDPNTDIPLWAATLEAGWLLADYREGDGGIRRYAIPAEHVIYVRQSQAASTIPAPQRLP